MSDDSSSEESQPNAAYKAPWGALLGVFVVTIALFAPVYVIGPFFADIVTSLAVSVDVAFSILQILATVLSLLIIVFVLNLYKARWRDLGLAKVSWRYIAIAVAAFVGYFIISMGLGMVVNLFFQIPDQPQDIGYGGKLDNLALALAGLIIVVLVPFKEELIFRGFLFKGLRGRMPFWAAAIGVSVFFGLVHGQWNVGIDVFAMSMVSCYLVEKTNSLWPSIFLHMIKNGLAFYLLYFYNGS